MKKLLSILSMLILASVASAQPAVPQLPRAPVPVTNPQPCKLVLIVPQGARVWLDGLATSSVGTRREFNSMVDGSGYYEVKVRVDGKDTTRRVTVYGGKVTTEVFEEVSVLASPFERKSALPDNPDPLPVGDDNPWFSDSEQERIRSLWPTGLKFPEGLQFYRPTRQVQRSAVTDFPQKRLVNVLTVSFIPRPSFADYDVPGGLKHVPKSQWKSYVGIQRGKWIQHFDERVAFDGAYGGWLRRHNRIFEPDTVAVDLLVNQDDEPFEVRQIRYEDDGDYRARIAWRDETKAPVGYNGPGKQCATCHDKTGDVRYTSGNAPGGGANFSLSMKVGKKSE